MANDVTLRQLRYFAAAARTGRFSMAATDEHVSQSAVTNAVLALEAQLGVRLFDRHPHGVTLTPEGHNFHRRTQDILDSLDDAIREPGFQSYALRGSVRIAASYTVLGYFLPDLLARFRRRYPDVTLDLVDMDRPDIEAAVASGDVELGIALLSNVDKRDRFAHQVLVRSRRQLWTASGHPLLKASAPSLADIARYPYILLEVDEGERSTLGYWRTHGLTPDIALRTRSMEALRGLVAHGFGVTVLSDMVYRPWSLEGRKIEAVPITDAVPPMEAGLLWHPRAAMAKPAAAFRQFMMVACGV
ncbi:LysR substrate-binding domain-containing protein [Achromobacter spanius]|jgi:DNA-binding transcriptional LysR family regulator|uniref:LysR substrate-binding domain-containing protein n=1 Tax=Achromobacter spanius TaxID=217203 RepID=A0AA42LUH9_9BURK|nr:LysR substrate-binding domain-containing protein [Achromobacter spanius]MDH0739693.1 LysR substrate-binding domain-containing protein [Achromobacter spanius]